jgi:peptidoglycan/xylan/chitin deacetylase (PgdA/CDA1 family)
MTASDRFSGSYEEKSICRILSRMDDSALSDYNSFLTDHVELSCSEKLVSRIESFYANANEQAEADFASLHGRSSGEVHKKLPVTVEKINVGEGPFLTNGGLPRGSIALTFDDGPHPSRTKRLLDILDSFSAKATFFMMGKNASAYPESAKEVSLRGHSVGSHSWDHTDQSKKTTDGALENIWKGHRAVEESAVDRVFAFYRFPYGAMTKAQRQAVKDAKLANFFWNMDTLDWKIKNPSELVRYSLEQADKAGSRGIMLFHDIQEQTIQAMPFILAAFVERGYNLVLYEESDAGTPVPLP